MKIETLLRSATLLLFVTTAPAAFAQDKESKSAAPKKESKSSADLVDQVIKPADRKSFYTAFSELNERIRDGGSDGEKAGGLLLSQREAITADPVVGKLIDDLKSQKKSAIAAQLLLQIARAKNTVSSLKKGYVAVGQVVISDGKLDPELVLAQMEILPEGYFAGEVGDRERPLSFRGEGYSNLDVSLKGTTGDLVYLGPITLKSLSKDQAASLKGKVTLDDPKGAGTTSIKLMLGVPRSNTPHNGYSPRHRWPEPINVTVSKSGEFTAKGLSPSDYRMLVEATGHTRTMQPISLAGGEEKDAGIISLKTNDLGFYLGMTAPKTGALPWEKDYASALKKAQAEKKPVMVMLTATWCGPCKQLEKETLNDPWIRYFLQDFVIVQAYEDKDVEKIYPSNGYPTLIFTDSSGKEAHRTVGHQPVLAFATVFAKAYAKLGLKPPAELRKLLDQKVIASTK